jgi:hypothetical protein
MHCMHGRNEGPAGLMKQTSRGVPPLLHTSADTYKGKC